MKEIELTPEQQQKVKDSLLIQFKTFFSKDDTPLSIIDKSLTISDIYDYILNEDNVTVYELIVNTTKNSLITYDFEIAPETEEEVDEMLASVIIKLNVRQVDTSPIFDFFSPMKIDEILNRDV